MEYIRVELSPRRIAGSGTTVLVTGRAFLGNVRLNASSGAIYIFDTASTTTPPLASAIAVIASGTLVLGNDFNYVMANGITIGSFAANSDYTVAAANN